jgi:hypothetical protein
VTNPLDILRSARLPETTVPVCVRGDLAAEVEALDKRLAGLNGQADRLVGNPEARQFAEQIEALRAEMVDSTVVLRLRALSHRDYAKLEAAHKPRTGEDGDQRTGFNMETFPEALIRACVVDPELDDDTWDTLVDALTFQQWDNLFTEAYMLNRREVSVPFSVTASRILQPSGEK